MSDETIEDPRTEPMHTMARQLASEAVAAPEADVVAIEAEALTACLVALARVPMLRREPLIDFLRSRLAKPTYVEILGGIATEWSPALTNMQEEIRQLRIENARLKKLARAAEEKSE